VFCDGLMFGVVADNMLYLRVDEHNRETFKEAEAFAPLNYEKKGNTIDLSFWRAPERLFDEPESRRVGARNWRRRPGRGEEDNAWAQIPAVTVVTP
jgi:DNA transformation protein